MLKMAYIFYSSHVEPIHSTGVVTARSNGKGVILTIPRMTGFDARSIATVRILSMTGREMCKKAFS